MTAAKRSIPDHGAWMGSQVGMDGPAATLLIECTERVHGDVPLPVRELRRGENGAGWFINPNIDMVRDDPTPLGDLPPGSPAGYRLHLDIRCPDCDMNVALTGGDTPETSTVAILDLLVDGGAKRIALRRLCGLVSNWH